MSTGTGHAAGGERLISYAQNFEDVLLWRVFKNLETGFYVDVGANSPTLFSTTRLFYDRGWRGVNIEPVESWIRQLESERTRDVNLQLCISDAPGEVELVEVVDTGLSTGDRALAESYGTGWETRKIPCEARTLASVLEEHGAPEIHFLKVDVEGMEAQVLAGADFTQHRPWVIIVESVHPGTHEPSHEPWEHILLASGYELLWFDGLNRFYGACERHDEVAPHFVSPPNVLDGFVGVDDEDRGQRLHKLSAEHHETREELNRTHALLRKEMRYSEQLKERSDGLEQQLHEQSDALALAHNSLSWRVTAPLRRLASGSRRLLEARRKLLR